MMHPPAVRSVLLVWCATSTGCSLFAGTLVDDISGGEPREVGPAADSAGDAALPYCLSKGIAASSLNPLCRSFDTDGPEEIPFTSPGGPRPTIAKDPAAPSPSGVLDFNCLKGTTDCGAGRSAAAWFSVTEPTKASALKWVQVEMTVQHKAMSAGELILARARFDKYKVDFLLHIDDVSGNFAREACGLLAGGTALDCKKDGRMFDTPNLWADTYHKVTYRIDFRPTTPTFELWRGTARLGVHTMLNWSSFTRLDQVELGFGIWSSPLGKEAAGRVRVDNLIVRSGNDASEPPKPTD